MHGTPHIVSDVMLHTVAAVGRGAAFKETVQLMREWKVGALPVIEGEGRVVGMSSSWHPPPSPSTQTPPAPAAAHQPPPVRRQGHPGHPPA